MREKSLRRALALGLLLVLLTSCAPPGPDALEAGTIRRHPAASVRELEADTDYGFSDLRGMDLRGMDLSDRLDGLFAADFDIQTKWPDAALLPEDFDPAALLDLGRDPGLGLREVHAQGVTGKGVGIAVIDQTLLVEHQEYADRVRLYEEYHTAVQDDASMHGAAVASIALGQTVGVAPEALLYFIADDVGTGSGANFKRDLTYYAEDVRRLTALNETLPEGEKIRVISMSIGWMPDTPGAEAMETAIRQAREAGIAVVCVNSRDPLLEPWMGMGRTPYGDPNALEDCRPGLFWEEELYSGDYRGGDGSLLLVPMDRRTLASPAGADQYAHFASGGMSWAVPWVAGLYALACQVKPDVTFEEFNKAAQAAARPLSITHDGTEYPYGRAVDPQALLEALAGSRAPAGVPE